ncbi:MAG: hypothetical protein WB767_07105 [Nocardioides sp.]
MSGAPPVPSEVDPFDLPDALGAAEVIWSATDGIHCGARVGGILSPSQSDELACDLLAVDEAYPTPVASNELRSSVHLAWRHGQVQLAAYDDRLTILVPGRAFNAELVLEAVGRLAKAVGADPSDYSVRLRLGS